MDWIKMKTEYITDESMSYRKLAEKYNIPLGTLWKRAKREGWVELRKQSGDRLVEKTVAAIEDKQADKMSRIQGLADKLLDKIEEAIEELNLQVVRNVERTKTLSYENSERPDKVTKEVIHEEEKVNEVDTIVDRNGLNSIASALAKMKEVQMLKSDADMREQEARIAKLRKESEEEDKETTVIVQFDDETKKWSN